ncbi:hypothetical protein GCM10009777_16560 [Microbacterium pumilum]|uniref:Uncharacterized protein n=1 Tax=Microbacterium pumilum TaxID=344165 RepID=A0ABN2SAL2_9MICO
MLNGRKLVPTGPRLSVVWNLDDGSSSGAAANAAVGVAIASATALTTARERRYKGAYFLGAKGDGYQRTLCGNSQKVNR